MEFSGGSEGGYGLNDRKSRGGSENFEGGGIGRGWAPIPATAKGDGRDADFRNRLPTSWAAPRAPLQWVVFMRNPKLHFAPAVSKE